MTRITPSSTVVPYITARRGEEAAPEGMLSLLPNGGGLCYLDEEPRDRDEQGVLWARCTQNWENGWPAGPPQWKNVHPSRQREAMTELRCQVCITRPASRTPLGYLFLTTRRDATERADGAEGALSVQPPLCLEHALVATEQCPHVALAYRVRLPPLYGVLGTLYRTGPDLRPIPAMVSDEMKDKPLPYSERLLRPWFLASQLVRELRGVTVVDLDREMAAAHL